MQRFLRCFESDTYTIRFSRGNYTDPLNMITELRSTFAELGLDASEGDRAYCLVDADIDPSKNKKLAAADARTNGCISMIVSVPCFEVWYLCHFTASTRQYGSNAEVISALKRYIPGYTKEAEALYSFVSDRTETAIRNAKALEKHCLANGLQPHTTGFSPSTEVYKLVELLLG